MKSKKHRLIRYIIMSLLAVQLLMLPSVARASETQAERAGEIHLTFEDMAGAEIRMFRVGMNNQNGTYELEGAFQNYSVNLNEKSAALTLDSYIHADKIPADYSVCVDEEDVANFTNLPKGVYLIQGGRYETTNMIYTWNPIMVELPQWNNEKQLLWSLDIQGKAEADEHGMPLKLEVMKIWENDEKDKRPESVKIALICDEEMVEEIDLSEENNWTYIWENLSGESEWTVVEREVAEGYRVSMERIGNKIVITNTGNPEKPSHPSGPSDSSQKNNLPQTGQVWWPIILLLNLGILCLIIGIRLIYSE